jgi:hypothetical protein
MLVFHWRHLNEQKRQTTCGWSARSFDPDNLNPLQQQGKGLPDDGKLQHPNLYQVRRAKTDNAGRMVARRRGEGNEDGQAGVAWRQGVCRFSTMQRNTETRNLLLLLEAAMCPKAAIRVWKSKPSTFEFSRLRGFSR